MKSYGMYVVLLAILVAGCAPLALKPADLSWPIEDELTSNAQGMVNENRYSMTFSIKPLMYKEMKDSINVANKSIRLIRDMQGYYYITAPKFKNVYVFGQGSAGLVLENTIAVSKVGLSSPAFNQREPYIELINGNDKPIMLTKDGIHEEEKK